ncbi:TetR/AcrR family transcriptional regulator [Brassicibacter mesophilus]|uniref:TetR/AcrR family transcriptional regulator n=1 Tax=Brassicibacter mesophilus TaxID=745119 RepID=UPI003D21B140
MSPKVKFSKEDIVDAAFEIGKEKGFSGITARSVAKRLGCSVAPIYVNFETIDELITAVVEHVFAVSYEFLAKEKGSNLFESMGKASLAFAREYPIFFRELVMKGNPYMTKYEAVENAMVEALETDESMKEWTISERKRIFLKMRIFQIGLSTMVANGYLPSWLNNQDAEQLLLEVGEELLLAQSIRRKEEQK